MPTNKKNKTNILKNLPKNMYDRTLSPEETEEVLKLGWQTSYPKMCDKCRCAGCEKCHYTGIILCLYKYKGENYFGTPPLIRGSENIPAVIEIMYDYNHNLIIRAIGTQGEATLRLTTPQLYQFISKVMATFDNPKHSFKLEYVGSGSFRGPPSLAVAGLRTRTNVSFVPTDDQSKAVKLLMENGLMEEANLLLEAIRSEHFRTDEKERVKARRTVGKLKPGTVFSRKGDTVVMEDGTTLKIDPDKSMLSMIR